MGRRARRLEPDQETAPIVKWIFVQRLAGHSMARITRALRAVRERADHRYLLAGLLRCGVCGRRLESCWANNRAAHRCRHGHTSSARRDPDRPKNLYVREDRILTHLPALHILLNETDPAEESAATSSTSADVISHLRTREIVLVYDPQTRALRADTAPTGKITIGRTG